jgi:hypothetical protein
MQRFVDMVKNKHNEASLRQADFFGVPKSTLSRRVNNPNIARNGPRLGFEI